MAPAISRMVGAPWAAAMTPRTRKNPTPRATRRGAVGTRGRAVGGHEEAVLHLLGELVLEGPGQAVGLVPRVAQHVGEKALDDAVATHRLGRLPPAGTGQLDAAVGTVIEQAPAG